MHSTIQGYLAFENVTMVPYDKNLLDVKLLSKRDIGYINSYHDKIWRTLSPILESREEMVALQWLREATSVINN